MKKDIIKFVSPISVKVNATDCVELIIYDNDGPEGFFRRLRFNRSSEAILFIMDSLRRRDIRDLNFTITNYWKQNQNG